MTILVAAAVTSIVGWLVIGKRARCGWVAGLALSFAAGAGVLSFQMLIYSLARVPWNAALVLLPWAPVAYLRLRGRRPALGRIERLSWLESVAVAAAMAAPLLWLPYERVMPLNTRNWDAWAIWLFKAKAFYLDGDIQTFLARAGEFAAQPSYPLLIPLYGTFLYTLTGSPADHVAKALSPCYFFSLLGGVLYYLARRFGPRPAALVFTAIMTFPGRTCWAGTLELVQPRAGDPEHSRPGVPHGTLQPDLLAAGGRRSALGARPRRCNMVVGTRTGPLGMDRGAGGLPERAQRDPVVDRDLARPDSGAGGAPGAARPGAAGRRLAGGAPETAIGSAAIDAPPKLP